MSVQTDPLPPVPEQAAPLTEDQISPPQGKLFSHPWTRWFTSLREKVNALNESLINLADVSGTGFLAKDGASWLVRSIQGTLGRISVINGTGAAGNPTIDLESSGVTPGIYGDSSNVPVITVDTYGRITAISTVPVSGGGGTTYSPWSVGSLPANVSASDGNFKLTRHTTTGSSAPVYHNVGRSSGKYALRFLAESTGAAVSGPGVGFLTGTVGLWLGYSAGGRALWINNGASVNEYTYINNSGSNKGNLAPFTSPTEIMLEIDLDAGKAWMGVAGTFIGGGNPVAGTGETFSWSPGGFYSPVADMFYLGTVKLLTPPDFITPASSGYTPGWPD